MPNRFSDFINAGIVFSARNRQLVREQFLRTRDRTYTGICLGSLFNGASAMVGNF